MLLFVKIGFLPITVGDVLDILIVGYLLYQLYKLLRGSLGFNIFIGLVLIYVAWWLVGLLNMDMLALILEQFLSVGVVLLLIVFQPEVRRFLLLLGRSTIHRRSPFWNRFMNQNLGAAVPNSRELKAVLRAMENFSRTKTGALIVVTQNPDAEEFKNMGVLLGAQISTQLLESIFQKESPLHDGAVVIANLKVHAASVILPVSENKDVPSEIGLRHRAAIGITENSKVVAIVVSEETGKISYARNGRLNIGVGLEDIERILARVLVQ